MSGGRSGIFITEAHPVKKTKRTTRENKAAIEEKDFVNIKILLALGVHFKNNPGPLLLTINKSFWPQIDSGTISFHYPQNDLSGHLSLFDRMLILARCLRNFHGNITIDFVDGDYPVFIYVPLAPQGLQKVIGKDAML